MYTLLRDNEPDRMSDVLYPTVKNTLTGRIAFPALDALREGYDVYPVVDAIAGTSVEAHRAGLERRAVLVGLSALVLASDVIGGVVYDAPGPRRAPLRPPPGRPTP